MSVWEILSFRSILVENSFLDQRLLHLVDSLSVSNATLQQWDERCNIVDVEDFVGLQLFVDFRLISDDRHCFTSSSCCHTNWWLSYLEMLAMTQLIAKCLSQTWNMSRVSLSTPLSSQRMFLTQQLMFSPKENKQASEPHVEDKHWRETERKAKRSRILANQLRSKGSSSFSRLFLQLRSNCH